MLGVIKCGGGNFKSVVNLLNYSNIKFKSVENFSDFKNLNKIILPGVGSYKNLMNNLENADIKNILYDKVCGKKIPFLGICVGMQILSDFGYEFETTEGLRIISGEVKKIQTTKETLPNIGWHEIKLEKKDSPLFRNLSDDELCFYFVHSYAFNVKDKLMVSSSINYGEKIPATIEKENIFGTQFHPEKSQLSGMKLIHNFLKI